MKENETMLKLEVVNNAKIQQKKKHNANKIREDVLEGLIEKYAKEDSAVEDITKTCELKDKIHGVNELDTQIATKFQLLQKRRIRQAC